AAPAVPAKPSSASAKAPPRTNLRAIELMTPSPFPGFEGGTLLRCAQPGELQGGDRPWRSHGRSQASLLADLGVDRRGGRATGLVGRRQGHAALPLLPRLLARVGDDDAGRVLGDLRRRRLRRAPGGDGAVGVAGDAQRELALRLEGSLRRL